MTDETAAAITGAMADPIPDPATDPIHWTPVADLVAIPLERAVPVRVGAAQVAVVRLIDGSIHAVGNRDPFSGAQVTARGIVGSICVGGTIHRTLASPMYKQTFYLATGRCTTDDQVCLGTWSTRVVDDRLEVGKCVDPPTTTDVLSA